MSLLYNLNPPNSFFLAPTQCSALLQPYILDLHGANKAANPLPLFSISCHLPFRQNLADCLAVDWLLTAL